MGLDTETMRTLFFSGVAFIKNVVKRCSFNNNFYYGNAINKQSGTADIILLLVVIHQLALYVHIL